MNDIHEIDLEFLQSLHNMISSTDEIDQEIAVEILNNTNFKDPQTLELVMGWAGCNPNFMWWYEDKTKKFTFWTHKQYKEYQKERQKHWD